MARKSWRMTFVLAAAEWVEKWAYINFNSCIPHYVRGHQLEVLESIGVDFIGET